MKARLMDGNSLTMQCEPKSNEYNNAYGINYWYVGDAARWYIVLANEIEVPMNKVDDYYATAYLPFPVATTDGVVAYTGAVNGDALKLTAVDGTVPAGTGLVLVSSDNAATPTIADANATTAVIDANDLAGTYTTQTIDAESTDYLVLSTRGGELGFYLPQAGTTTLVANKAYLPASVLGGAAVQGLKLSFSGSTAIDAAPVAPVADEAIYDLSGRRVVNPTHGLYIRGGKKIYVK